MPQRHLVIGLLAAALAAAGHGLLRASQAEPSQALAIRGVRVIDGTGAPPREGMTVIVEGERIAALAPDAAAPVPANARIIDGTGKTLLPGLIDTHVHFRDYVAELLLAHGVTTVRDAGNPPEWILPLKKLQANGRMRGPRIFAVGNILDAPPAQRGHHLAVETPGAARAAARRLLAMGVDGIKVYDQLTPELLRPIADEAHAAGRRVIGHINFSAAEAALAGIDALEHASGIAIALARDPEAVRRGHENRGVYGWREMDPAKIGPLVSLLVEREVAVVPALASWGRGSALRAAFQAEAARTVADPGLAYLPAEAHARVKGYGGARWPPEERRAYEADYAALRQFLRRFHGAGGKIVAGTDGGALLGLSVHHEMRLLVEVGLAPLDAIRAATSNAAELIQAADLGVVAPGRIADLLLVEGNPARSIDDTKRIALVIQRGRVADARYHRDYRIPIARPPVEGSRGE